MSYTYYDDLERQLRPILCARYPSFIFIRDLSCANIARSTLKNVLSTLRQEATTNSEKPTFALVDCIACFALRLLFDSVLFALVDCCFEADADAKRDVLTSQKNDSLDDFLHNIRLLFPESDMGRKSSSSNEPRDPVKLVVVLEHAGRLRDTLPRLIHPLSRLQELTRLNITTVFLSEDAWDAITPIPGTLADPYTIEVDTLNRQDIIERIYETFPKDVSPDSISIFNPCLEALFRHFVEAVYDVCSPFISEPAELAYIVSARWPGFVATVLDDWKRQSHRPLLPPSEETRMRLLRVFNPSLMSAIESLYPRSMERTEWSTANSLPVDSGLRDLKSAQVPSKTVSAVDSPDSVPKLSVLSMFIALAAFIASYNPAKTDYRMFGRGVDEKSRRRRKGGGTRKTKPGTIAKLPQRLVGPMSFPYDRLIAILGSLLREYDESKQAMQTAENDSELKAEVDVYRVQTSASIRELISLRLLHRATMQERLDNLSLRSGIGYDQALLLARKLGIPLNDLMWEPN